MKLAAFEVLSADEIRQIHQATVEILRDVGIRVSNPRMLDRLAALGLSVDRASSIVRISQTCLENAISTVPRQFEVFDRDGAPAFLLGDGTPRIAAGHNAVFWVDSETGETRPSRVADVELFSRICEALPAIDMIGIPVMPQDVPDPRATLLYGVRAVIANSRKPIFFSTDNNAVNHAIIEMCAAAFAGDLATRAYGISQLSPTSPLTWEPAVLDALAETVARGVPLAFLPEPNAGVSSPFTLAGLLTVHNAECLSGVVIAQLLQPGAPVLYASSWTTTDMRNGAALVGSTETSLCRIAGAQLSRFYHIPHHTTAPNSDNHAHDEQNAWEKALSTFCSVGAGADLIVNCGMFATGLTCSHEQLLMDEEISAMSLRIAAGIQVDTDTIAQELIAKVGPGGTGYLTADHTLEWLHSKEYLQTCLTVRGPRASWEAAGGKDTYQLARGQVREHQRTTTGCPLVDNRMAHLDEIIRSFAPAAV